MNQSKGCSKKRRAGGKKKRFRTKSKRRTWSNRTDLPLSLLGGWHPEGRWQP